MTVYTDIYVLLDDDVTGFKQLNALPENSHGPQVVVSSYRNTNPKSSVKFNFTGTPDATIANGLFIFSGVGALWVVTDTFVLDSQGNATEVYAECVTPGEMIALAGTLNTVFNPSMFPDILKVTNPYDAIVSKKEFLQCVDSSITQNPIYQPWVDVMNENQPISTRELITIMMD